MTDPRRTIPRTDTVLADPRLVDPLRRLGRATVKAAVAAAQQRIREAADPAWWSDPDLVVQLALAHLPRGPVEVLNATGVVVHTNLGRAPLSSAAILAVGQAAGYTDVEFDLASGKRHPRGESALHALRRAVPDAGDVHVVNNNAAALLLCALVLAQGREIVISRGELVEIGDGFRIPDLLESTGARLREVGTTNRTTARDFADAVGDRTGFILRVHPSNYRVTGFTSAPDLAELTDLGVPLVVDIGSGLLTPHPLLPDEPDAASALRAGAALVTASADKLLGGPQAGLLLGDAGLVTRLRRHPSARALRVDKLTLAALEATLLDPRTPVAEAVAAREPDLRARAEEMSRQLVARGVDARAVPSVSVIGGGGAPGVEFPSAAVSLPHRYAEALRLDRTPVVGRVEGGRCLLDLRAVPAHPGDEALVEAVLRCT
ncbi:L-seryl-tRNA(Sec) selenium transferase [Actinokineospora auranticolor]|uniref:L-seryl-tRNA(Sec) selenium transferase n=1 Tax=Actinokineospora auranticolor TaxID=155976 RepID=A0A2S6GPU1_9PSEU|nr:L-seryl-tRNA(Sec) selenium transferase [Actinokineospora auranticolor]PPK67190.1 L-seryl-tRNA(Ser) seleniumtransferase [Actinokineospora auranticolor]